jgi:hypothetical protein
MINRLKQYDGDGETPSPPEDYWVVEARTDTFYVTAAAAAGVLAQLEGRTPRWISFTTLSGAAIRIRAGVIDCVRESTAAQRQAARDFHKARREEYRADCPPWEEDW